MAASFEHKDKKAGVSKMMTLDEAIEHAKDVGFKMACNSKTCECGKEHLQLAKWLEELRELRKRLNGVNSYSNKI